MSHFIYDHLPAYNLGHRDPIRPFATGGIGLARKIFFPASILRMRTSRLPFIKPGTSIVEGVEQ